MQFDKLKFEPLINKLTTLQKHTKVYIAFANEVKPDGTWKGRGDPDFIGEYLGTRNPDEEMLARGSRPLTSVGVQGVFKVGIDPYTEKDDIRDMSPMRTYVAVVPGGGKRRSKKTRKSKRSSKKTLRRRR